MLPRMLRPPVGLAVAVVLTAGACSASDGTPTATSDEAPTASAAPSTKPEPEPSDPSEASSPTAAATSSAPSPTATATTPPTDTGTPDAADGGHAADSSTIRELTLPEGAPGDAFGTSVDVHAATVVAGAPGHGDGAVAVYYARAGEQLDLITVLEPPTPGAGGFGRRVAVRDDLIAVTDAAATVHIHERREGRWEHTAALPAPDGATAAFGASLAVGADQVVVGSPPAPERPDPGRAYVFAPLQGAPWTHVDTLEAPQPDRSAAFAHDVDVTPGGTIVVGAPSSMGDPGAVHVYEDAAGYRHAATLTASDGAEFSRFGAAVAAWSGPASPPLVLVGAPGHDGAGEQAGRVHRYERGPDGAWTETGTIDPPSDRDPAHRGFGTSVDLAGPQVLAVAALGPRDADVGPRGGPGYVHVMLPDRTLVLEAPLAADSSFGAPVALSDGLVAVSATAHADHTGAIHVGFVR